MRIGFADQYSTPCAMIDLEELPLDGDELIEDMRESGATFWHGLDGELFVVQFGDDCPEVYSERALRASVRRA